MTLSTQPYKGARDFYPEDKRIQKYMFTKLRETCERYGYEEYDAPILEPTDLFLAKGNQEIIDEQTYTFRDRGDRSVTIRTEMTPSVSRMVAARRQELAYPLRWYSLPELWRYERMQRGRLRQFWQLNADIFGVDGIEADFEIIQLSDALLKNFGADSTMYEIRINSRQLTNYIFESYLGLNEPQQTLMSRLIDRMRKMDQNVFYAQAEAILSSMQRDAGAMNKLQAVLGAKKLNHLPAECQNHASVRELIRLSDLLTAVGIHNVEYDPTLMRGFDYYTDVVYEVFDSNPDNNRSMFGGGRYDGLVGMFGVEPVPTVGFGMGDVTLLNFLQSHDLLPEILPTTDVTLVLIGENVAERSMPVTSKLRSMGVNTAIDVSGRKLEKQLKNAVKSGVPFVLFVGENELNESRFKLRDMVTGVEEIHGLERIATIIRDYRQRQLRISKQLPDDPDEIDF